MFRAFLFAATVAVSAAFQPMAGSRAGRVAAISMADKSVALPFLDKPAKLDGSMVGDFGFDPLGFTENLPSLSYVQAAELKHGRVAMLATLGFAVQEKIQLVQPAEANPLKAVAALGYGPNLQILFAIGCIELATWDKTFKEEAGGDFGFDPAKFLVNKSEAEIKKIKLQEVKNGRLAMIAIMGMFAQTLATDGAPLF